MRSPTQIFRTGGRGSSVQMDTDLLCGFGLKMAETMQKANFVRNNAGGSRKTSLSSKSKYLTPLVDQGLMVIHGEV